MEYKKLTTITIINTGTGPRLAYTYEIVNDQGITTEGDKRGAMTLIDTMKEQMAAVDVLRAFLAARLPKKGGAPVLKSFCIYAAPAGDRIVYLYDVFDAQGQSVTKNNQDTLTLVPEAMKDQKAAVETLRAFLIGKL